MAANATLTACCLVDHGHVGVDHRSSEPSYQGKIAISITIATFLGSTASGKPTKAEKASFPVHDEQWLFRLHHVPNRPYLHLLRFHRDESDVGQGEALYQDFRSFRVGLALAVKY